MLKQEDQEFKVTFSYSVSESEIVRTENLYPKQEVTKAAQP